MENNVFDKFQFLEDYEKFDIQEVWDNFKELSQEHYFFGLKLPYEKCCFSFSDGTNKIILHCKNDKNVVNEGIFCGLIAADKECPELGWYIFGGSEDAGIVWPIKENGFHGGLDCVYYKPGEEEKAERYAQVIDMFKWVVFLSLLLLNCKSFRPIKITNSSIKNLHRIRNGKTKLRDYYKLSIPLYFRPQKGESLEMYKNRLHSCRGHFKCYDESGLFGKFRGIYWWNSQLRGNNDIGIIKKEYKLKTMS